jgi:hypothetical protein
MIPPPEDNKGRMAWIRKRLELMNMVQKFDEEYGDGAADDLYEEMNFYMEMGSISEDEKEAPAAPVKKKRKLNF